MEASRLTGDASSGVPPHHASPHERDEAKAAALFTAHVRECTGFTSLCALDLCTNGILNYQTIHVQYNQTRQPSVAKALLGSECVHTTGRHA